MGSRGSGEGRDGPAWAVVEGGGLLCVGPDEKKRGSESGSAGLNREGIAVVGGG